MVLRQVQVLIFGTLLIACQSKTGLTVRDGAADLPAADRPAANIATGPEAGDAAIDARVTDGPAADHASADVGIDVQPGTSAALCLTTGGTLGTALCCANTADYPDTCMVGACGCAPASSTPVPVCNCPGRCFSILAGCAVCAYGFDPSCNDSPIISSIHGRCQADGTCLCNSPWTMNPATGRCN